MSLVVVGAHALDAELMGGPLAAVASDAGWPVALLHLTLGERGHPSKPPDTFGPQVLEESVAAARFLGADAVWSGAAAPLDEDKVLAWLIAEIRVRRPALIVTHWRGSWHPSHRAAHRVVRRAVSSAGVRARLAYGENCEDLAGFSATHIVAVGPVYARWLKAVSSYELFRRSEPGSDTAAAIPYWAYYTAALRVHGLHFDLGEAQAFMSSATLPTELGFRRVSTPAELVHVRP